MTVEPFRVHVDDEVLADLWARIRATRWPDQVPGIGWDQGTELGYLRGLLAYWADGFDWRARERELNAYPQFRVALDGVPIHFVHAKAPSGNGVPLILTHGWPSGVRGAAGAGAAADRAGRPRHRRPRVRRGHPLAAAL